MSFDDHYSRYYDLLYADKDYRAEAAYVLELLNRHCTSPVGSMLELGCGSGVHAEQFSQQGISVFGIDSSQGMLEKAALRMAACPNDTASRLHFELGDVRQFRGTCPVDAVVSLFHVFSYQTSDGDLDACLKTAAINLKKGGMLLFDFWYGPAVLTDPPVVRVKRMEDESMAITRIAEPTLLPENNCVEIDFTIFVSEKSGNATSQHNEQHRMRYFFLPELRQLLSANGFEIKSAVEWMTDKPLDLASWYGTICAARSS